MSAKRVVPHALPGKPPSVLVVDGDEDTRALYRYAFEQHGYEVLEARDGREALTKALVRPPSLVVTETTLAHIDGYALCQILRQDRTTVGTPIVVVAAESRPAQIHRARKAGADAVLTKPVGTEALLTAVAAFLSDSCQVRDDADVRDAETARTVGRPSTRHSRASAFARYTTMALGSSEFAPLCPSCERPLIYERSHIGGVNATNAERWDDYSCASCGLFQYRHRTRKLTRMRDI